MIVLSWVAATLFLTLFTVVALGNAWTALRFYFRGRPGSQVPFVGGLAGTIGLLVLPISAVSFSWIPLILDVGC